MKNTKHIPRIIVFLFLLVHVPLRAVPDLSKIQQVAEEILQSILERMQVLSPEEVKCAIWDLADGISKNDLKQFFPEECSDFKTKGSFREEMNVVQTWFTYADFSFSCVFHANFNTSLLEKIVLYEGENEDDKYWLWTLFFPPLAEDKNLTSN